MPWHLQAMKDVFTSDMLRGVGRSFDPEISEWGNPAGVMPGHKHLSKVGCLSDTCRIETS